MTILKWTVGVIALVNVALYLWPENQPAEHGTAAIAAPVNPESMRLLREPTVSSDKVDLLAESPAQALAQSLAQSQPPPECGKIGPYVSREQLEFARAQLNSLGLNHSENIEPGRSTDVLRLYLVSRSAAGLDSLRANLNDAGITDHFKMASEEGQYMLSLGVYSEPERADRVAVEYRGLGFDVRIRDEVTLLPDRSWLLVGLEGRSSQLVRTLSGMIWGTPGVGFSADSCQI